MEPGKLMAGILATTVAALALPPSASAATVIGSTGVPNDVFNPAEGSLRVQDVDPGEGGDLYRVPAAGVITSWSSQANATAGRTQKLLITRNPDLDNNWDVVARDQLQTLATPNALNTFLTRISVAAGDQLALYAPDGQPGDDTSISWNNNPSNDTVATYGGTEPSMTFNVASFSLNTRLNVTATIEPDADGDGYGDETQDQCPSQAGTAGFCVTPLATQSPGTPKKCKKPKKKTKASASAKKRKGCKKARKRK